MVKQEEKIVLNKFRNVFDRSINILSKEEANSIYPNYNGENPDCIIKFKSEIIGIELFELIKTNNENLLMSKEEKEHGIKNIKHLTIIREQLGTNLLYVNEDLPEVAIERINDKIQNKLKNYIPEKIWLLGYLNQQFNFALLKSEIDDGTIEQTLHYIKNNIAHNKRVEKIFLFQCYKEPELFEVLRS